MINDREDRDRYIEETLAWWKKLNKKLAGKPFGVQIIQKRTMNTACKIIENIWNVPFEQISLNMYFYCNDIKMNEFTRLFEAQIELAGVNREKFVFGLHNFYNLIAVKIKKNDLYSEFFEFYYKCSRLWKTYKDKPNINMEVIIAYVNLLTQVFEYIKPNKYDFSKIIAGRKTNGELMLREDENPYIDLAGYDFQNIIQNNELYKYKSAMDAIRQCYEKYGYYVESEQRLNQMMQIENINSSVGYTLLPLITEYTYDILPVNLFKANVKIFCQTEANINIEELKEKLTHRRKTLPTNGVYITYRENPAYSSLLLKEVLYDDTIILLYKMETSEGDLSGFYDTGAKLFFSPLSEHEIQLIYENVQAMVLYAYGCYVLGEEDIQISKYREVFRFINLPLAAEGFLQGGKLKNTYDKERDEKSGTGRKGNDKYTTENVAIQGYIRKLPVGQNASEEAKHFAKVLGYDLLPTETYIRPFSKQVFKLKEKNNNRFIN